MNFYKLFLLTFLLLLNTSFILAQSDEKMESSSSFSTDYMKEIDAAKEKLLALADAMPQDKFSWRPEEGVRSVSEVFMHVVGANYYLLSFAGEKMPEGFKQDMEKTVTDKKEIIGYLKDSYDNVKNFMSSLDENTLDDPVEFFGMKSTKRHLLFILLDHSHEHLGQSIAYARTNGITPPWSIKK